MALPNSRNTNYSPTDSVKSADLLDFQDQIIALEAKRKRTQNLIISPFSGKEIFSSNAEFSGDYVRNDGSVGTAVLYYDLPVEVDDVLERFIVHVQAKSGGGSNLIISVLSGVMTGLSSSNVATTTVSSSGTAILNLGSAVVAANNRYYATVSLPSGEDSYISYLEFEKSRS